MRNAIVTAAFAAGLAACAAMPELAPIPGSITYNGQPATKLTKAPVGSVVRNRLKDQYGRPSEETYVIQPDRSLRLVRREAVFDGIGNTSF
jgi:hypothetical protein